MEDGFSLTSITGLLAVVTAFPLSKEGGLFIWVVCVREGREGECWGARVVWYLAGLVLGYFVVGVLFAVSALAVGAASLRDVDLEGEGCQ